MIRTGLMVVGGIVVVCWLLNKFGARGTGQTTPSVSGGDGNQQYDPRVWGKDGLPMRGGIGDVLGLTGSVSQRLTDAARPQGFREPYARSDGSLSKGG